MASDKRKRAAERLRRAVALLRMAPAGNGSDRGTTWAQVATLTALSGACALATFSLAAGSDNSRSASPIFGVTIPDGYRQWEFIAPALEMDPLNELRVVLGNPVATEAYRSGQLPFPNGSVLVKLAWKHVTSPEFEPALVPGAATTVQVMVKDADRYASTGGWGFGRFIDGKAVDVAQHQSCWSCHEALVVDHDFVFTRLAP